MLHSAPNAISVVSQYKSIRKSNSKSNSFNKNISWNEHYVMLSHQSESDIWLCPSKIHNFLSQTLSD